VAWLSKGQRLKRPLTTGKRKRTKAHGGEKPTIGEKTKQKEDDTRRGKV
jgi:hypothetical protein